MGLQILDSADPQQTVPLWAIWSRFYTFALARQSGNWKHVCKCKLNSNIHSSKQEYSKCPKISNTSFWKNATCKECIPRSDSSWRTSLIRVYTVCYSTRYCTKELHEKHNLGQTSLKQSVQNFRTFTVVSRKLFFYFSTKHRRGTSNEYHNIGFCGEIRKIYAVFRQKKVLYLELWWLWWIYMSQHTRKGY